MKNKSDNMANEGNPFFNSLTSRADHTTLPSPSWSTACSMVLSSHCNPSFFNQYG